MTDHTPATDPADQIPGSPAPEPGTPRSFWDRWGELLVALGVALVGIIVLAGTQDIRVRSGVVVNPRIIPYIVGSGLLIVAIWYAIEAIRAPQTGVGGGEDSEDVDPDATTDWTVIGIIAVALIAYAILMGSAGFVIASTALFAISAFAMGSRSYLRDLLFGLVLAATIFLVFDGWLGVRLPDGWFDGLV